MTDDECIGCEELEERLKVSEAEAKRWRHQLRDYEPLEEQERQRSEQQIRQLKETVDKNSENLNLKDFVETILSNNEKERKNEEKWDYGAEIRRAKELEAENSELHLALTESSNRVSSLEGDLQEAQDDERKVAKSMQELEDEIETYEEHLEGMDNLREVNEELKEKLEDSAASRGEGTDSSRHLKDENEALRWELERYRQQYGALAFTDPAHGTAAPKQTTKNNKMKEQKKQEDDDEARNLVPCFPESMFMALELEAKIVKQQKAAAAEEEKEAEKEAEGRKREWEEYKRMLAIEDSGQKTNCSRNRRRRKTKSSRQVSSDVPISATRELEEPDKRP